MNMMYYCKKCHNIVFAEDDYTGRLCFQCEEGHFDAAMISEQEEDKMIEDGTYGDFLDELWGSNSLMKEKASDFLIFCYFGSRGNDIDSIINRAYVDMASHTMATFEDVNEKWSCRWNASNVIKEAIDVIDKPYDIWHDDTCNNIISQYPENVLSYGQAQKWLNMTVKYVYVLKLLGKFENQYKYISDEHVSEFHVPLDSYILENILDDKKTVWSKMSSKEYKEIRAALAVKSYDFLNELQEWDELVIGTRKYDKDSYGFYCQNK